MNRYLPILVTITLTVIATVPSAAAEPEAWPENPYLGGLPAITAYYTEAIEALNVKYKSFDYLDRKQYAEAAKVAEETEQVRKRWKTVVEQHVAEKQLVGQALPITGLADRPYTMLRAVIADANNRQIRVEVTLRIDEDLTDAAPREDWLDRGRGGGYGGGKESTVHFRFYFMAVDSNAKPIPYSGKISGADMPRTELAPGSEVTTSVIWSFENLATMQDFAGVEEITRTFYNGG